jgi:hypothetical protein
MEKMRALLVLGAALCLSACASTNQVADAGFRAPEGNYRMLVMQPDISVGVLTAGGSFEFREDWTETARQNIIKSLVAQQRKRGGETKIASTREETGADATLVNDLVWLHNTVGQSIKLHKYTPAQLPTKKDRFDWTLGERAVEFGAATQYDYALFLHAQDSFSSGGRVALQLVGALGCGFGVCVMPTGGQQAAFASLVDLKTGQVVWFNTLISGAGDIRTPDGADKMVKTLLDKMQPGGEQKKRSRRS